MKRTLLIAFLIGSLHASSQITVTATDVATVGFQIRQANDTFPPLVPGPGGASQTWNFSSLVADVIDTITFTNPNWLPNAASFPTSNLAVQFGTNGDGYLLLNATSLMMLGQVGDIGFGPIVIDMNPDEQIMKFPATMGTTFSNVSKSTVSFPLVMFPIDSARIKTTKTKVDTVDAWGTITTPLAPNIPSIRVKEFALTIDSFFVHATLPSPAWSYYSRRIDTSYNYSWWVNNTGNLYGFPLVEMRQDSSFTVTNASYLMATPTQSGIAELSLNSIPPFPNPSSDVITFLTKGLEIDVISILDATGREVKRIIASSEIVKVNVSDLASGSYHYIAYGPGNSMKKAGKFNISK